MRQANCGTVGKQRKQTSELLNSTVQETTAGALVTSSLLPMNIGERIRSGCAWERQVAERAQDAAVSEARPRADEDEAERAAREAFENVDIHFAFEAYSLSEDALGILLDKARFLEAHPGVQVLIEGHCDERGTEQYNLALGDRRAHAAQKYLTGLGIPEERMAAVTLAEAGIRDDE
jgi:peptidoglycan-associated lipoprotein